VWAQTLKTQLTCAPHRWKLRCTTVAVADPVVETRVDLCRTSICSDRLEHLVKEDIVSELEAKASVDLAGWVLVFGSSF
jgi:hypothetical protein